MNREINIDEFFVCFSLGTFSFYKHRITDYCGNVPWHCAQSEIQKTELTVTFKRNLNLDDQSKNG